MPGAVPNRGTGSADTKSKSQSCYGVGGELGGAPSLFPEFAAGAVEFGVEFAAPAAAGIPSGFSGGTPR